MSTDNWAYVYMYNPHLSIIQNMSFQSEIRQSLKAKGYASIFNCEAPKSTKAFLKLIKQCEIAVFLTNYGDKEKELCEEYGLFCYTNLESIPKQSDLYKQFFKDL